MGGSMKCNICLHDCADVLCTICGYVSNSTREEIINQPTFNLYDAEAALKFFGKLKENEVANILLWLKDGTDNRRPS